MMAFTPILAKDVPPPKVCRRCNKETREYHTNWPAGSDGYLCNDCWYEDALEYKLQQYNEAWEQFNEDREGWDE